MSSDHTSPVALITGGAQRVGRAVALELARSGFDLIVTYNNSKDEAHTLAAEVVQLGRQIHLVQADLRDENALDRMDAEITKTFDRLDVLINNASIYQPTPISSASEAAFNENMRINAYVPLHLTQRFKQRLIHRYNSADPSTAGRVINFVDTHILGSPMPDFVCYNASKAALLEITKTCARELAPAMTVNAIAPGVVAWSENYSQEKRGEILRRVPLGRAGTPEDAARAVRFLVSDGHYCTGEVLRLDGGYYLT